MTRLESLSPPCAEPILQRARGRAGACFSGGRLRDLHMGGSAKAMLPNTYSTMPHLVFVNTAGGVTGGDRFQWTVEAENSAVTATTQTAERIYRARASDAPGRIDTHLVARGTARIDWIPQETIAFDESRLARRLTVEIDASAEVTLLEPVVLGRAAMGERVARLHLGDQWRVIRDGRLAFADALRLDGALAPLAGRASTLAGRTAFASLVHLSPRAETRLEEARALIDQPGVTAGASAWNGALAIRMAADSPLALRRALVHFLEGFRGEALPRVWMM